MNRMVRLLAVSLIVGIAFPTAAAQPVSAATPAVNAAAKTESGQPEAMTQEKVDKANDAYNNNKDAAIEFISMSDTHVNTMEYKDWEFQNVREWTQKIGFNTATVMVGGDVEANEYHPARDSEGFYKTVVQVMKDGGFENIPVQFAIGNHDVQSYMQSVFDESGCQDVWYYKNDDGSNSSRINYHVKINGFDFITLDYHDYNSYLQQTLNEIKSASDYDPAKPIFLQIHSGLSGTTTGSDQDIGNTRTYLQRTLADTPQAIVMTAHSHYGAETERGIYQKDFTVVNNGSMDYLEVNSTNNVENSVLNWNEGNDDHYEDTCNYVTVLKDGRTVIRRFDVTNMRWMGIPWVIDTKAGKDGFQYTQTKYNKVEPWFEDDASIKMENVTENTADLIFDQAKDDQLVEYYNVTIKNYDTNENASYKVKPDDMKGRSSDAVGFTGTFKSYSRFYVRPYPEQMKFYLSELDPHTKYRVIVQAFDAFDNASDREDLIFTTGGEAHEFPHTLPESLENGKFLDMNFDNSDLTDSEGNITASQTGEVSFSDGIQGKGVHVKGSSGNYVDLGKDDRMNGQSTFSMNFWINTVNRYSDAPVISNKDWNSGRNPGWWFGFSGSGSSLKSFDFNVGDGSNRMDTGASGSFANTWRMVTLVYDRDAGKVLIYIDGKKMQDTDALKNVTGTIATDYSVKIGTDGTGNYGASTEFTMDNLQMWDRALTTDEIEAMYGTVTYKEDTTDYDQKLREIIDEANALIDAYKSGSEGISYSAKAEKRLEEAVAAAQNAQTTDEKKDAIANIRYCIENMQDSMKVSYISNKGFEVAYCDSWHGDHGESGYAENRMHTPEKAIDGDESSAWHTNWSVDSSGEALYPFPHTIIIDMKESYSLTGLQRIGRSSHRDYIRKVAVDAGDDLDALKSDDTPAFTGMYKDKAKDYLAFGKTLTGRYVKVTIVDAYLMYDAGCSGRKWAYTAELNFSGKKKVQTYNISYELNGGENAAANPAQYQSDTEGIELAAPTREGFTFDGWYDNKELTGEPVKGIAKGDSGDKTFYAKWTPKETEPETNQPETNQPETNQPETSQPETSQPGTETTVDTRNQAALRLSVKASGRKQKLSWNAVKGADGYKVYAAAGKKKLKLYKKLQGADRTGLTRNKLKKGKIYRYLVVAYKVENGDEKTIAASLTASSVAGRFSSRYSDVRMVKVAKKKVTLKAGKKAKIKAKLQKYKKNRKYLPKSYARLLRYQSSNTDVAVVSKSGKITAKQKGSCKIYVYAQNGKYTTVKVTVQPETSQPGTETTVDTRNQAALRLSVKASGRKQKLSWNAVKGADGYKVYAAAGKKKLKLYKKLQGADRTGLTRNKLKKGKIYRYLVVAYKVENGEEKTIAASLTASSVAGRSSSRYSDVRMVKVAKKKVTLKAGKTAEIKAKLQKYKKNRKYLPKSYARLLRYQSSNTDVAVVSKSGKITAKQKGSCKIYVYAQNGKYTTVKVTVK